jgi:thioredoxin-dependent peroxiredoxin
MSTKDALIGTEAPAFCLPDAHDRKICVQDFRGTWVVLYFYPRDNSSGCTLEAMQFSNELESFSGSDAVIIGVSPDSPESHRKFEEKHGLRLILLSDTGHEVIQQYGVWRKKVLYGRESMGVERSTFLIDPEGTVIETWRKVRVPGHIAAVLEALKRHRGTR